MSTTVLAPYPIFTDADGQPLEAGTIAIGEANQNAETHPIVAYWDSGLSVTALQPIATTGGYPSRSGSASQLYVAEQDYSLIVRDKNGGLVFSALSAETLFAAGAITYQYSHTGAVSRTLASRTAERLSVLDFGAVGDGTTDDATAIQAALTHIAANGGELYFPNRLQFLVGTPLTASLGADVRLVGSGELLIDITNGTGLAVTANGYNLYVGNGLRFDGNDKASVLCTVTQASQQDNRIIFEDVVFENAYTTSGDSHGLLISGGYADVNVKGCTFKDFNRELSLVVSSYGLQVKESTTFYALRVLVDGCRFEDISNNETSGTAAFENTYGLGISDVADLTATYQPQVAQVTNCTFRNIKGTAVANFNDRSIVTGCHFYQAVPQSTNSQAVLALNGPAGTVTNCDFLYEASASGEDTLVRESIPISIFLSADPSRTRVYNIDNIQVLNNSTQTLNDLQFVVGAGTPSAYAQDCIINISNVNAETFCEAFARMPNISGATVRMNISNCYADRITEGVVYAPGAGDATERLLHVSNFHNGNISGTYLHYVTTGTYAELTGRMIGCTNVLGPHTIGSDMLNAGFADYGLTGISSPTTGAPGKSGVEVHSQELADDATGSFGRSINHGLFFLTSNGDHAVCATCTSAGIFELFDTTGTISDPFISLGLLSNPNVDGDINVWLDTGADQIKVKNRLGGSRVFTMMIIGSRA